MPTPISNAFFSSFSAGSKEQLLNPMPQIHYQMLSMYDRYIKTQIMADSSYITQAKKILNVTTDDEVQSTLPMISNFGITLIDKQGKYHLIELDHGLKEKLNKIFKSNIGEIMEKLKTPIDNTPDNSIHEAFERKLEDFRRQHNNNVGVISPSQLPTAPSQFAQQSLLQHPQVIPSGMPVIPGSSPPLSNGLGNSEMFPTSTGLDSSYQLTPQDRAKALQELQQRLQHRGNPPTSNGERRNTFGAFSSSPPSTGLSSASSPSRSFFSNPFQRQPTGILLPEPDPLL